MNQPARETFSYGIMASRSEASLDAEMLKAGQGVRAFEIRVEDITHLYLRPGDRVVSLLVAVRGRGGKTRVRRLVANPGDAGFLALVDALVARRPEADVRGRHDQEVLRTLGVGRKMPWAVGVLLLCVPLTVAVVLFPRLMHGLDFGEERISVLHLAQGRVPGSRNVVVTGARAMRGEGLEMVATRGEGSESTRMLIPLVSPEWERSQPVLVLLSAENLSANEQAALDRMTKFSGIMRDAGWEGLRAEDRVRFTKESGLVLADGARVLEYGGNPRRDLVIYVGAVGMSFLVVAAMWVGLWLRGRGSAIS